MINGVNSNNPYSQNSNMFNNNIQNNSMTLFEYKNNFNYTPNKNTI